MSSNDGTDSRESPDSDQWGAYSKITSSQSSSLLSEAKKQFCETTCTYVGIMSQNAACSATFSSSAFGVYCQNCHEILSYFGSMY